MFTDSNITTTIHHSASSSTAIHSHVYDLGKAISRAQEAVLRMQDELGFWVFELEADCTIPAEYIMMRHYIGDINEALQDKIACYLRARQCEDGGFPLFTGGTGDISCSVKVYYALKMVGDSTEAGHMVRLRSFILGHGGAAKANVFTRIALAMFGQVPWRAVPYIPVEIMLLPKWFPFHLDKVSYWSRTVMVPLFILCTLKASAKNPLKINIAELFTTPPEQEQHYFAQDTLLKKVFLWLDKLGLMTEPLIPNKMRNLALKKAENWILERLNGEDGLGCIFPAMVNAYESLLLLGYPKTDERVVTARKAIDKLLVIKEHEAYCQPCFSPIWDTGLSLLALQEANPCGNQDSYARAYDWLKSKQLSDEPGDWRINKPDLAGGGWAFQYANPHYPDVDDTAVVAFAMACAESPDLEEATERAAQWIAGMQSANGGYGAFDIDNNHYYLNQIPFADHGALLDDPTADVTARCIMLLGKLVDKNPDYRPVLKRAVDFLRSEQEADGSWFGRWGTNYIYGTWSVLLGLEQTDLPKTDPMYSQAVAYLKSKQRADGGWGEDNFTYHDVSVSGTYRNSTCFQTAWALLGLMAANEARSPEVKAGIDFLLRHQQNDGIWHDPGFTAPGFPRVFYLKYHGYDKFFPLWALAR